MRRFWWAILMAVVVSLWSGIRLWFVAGDDPLAKDGTVYIRMARDFVRAPGQVVAEYDYAVGYPAAVAGVHRLWSWLTGDRGPEGWERAGRIVSFAASLAVLAGLWPYCKRAFDGRVALTTLILLSVGRKWAAVGADVLSDSLALAFEVWAIVVALAVHDRLRSGRRSSLFFATVVGLLAGLGYLVRPEALITVILAASLWIAARIRGRRNIAMGLAAAGLAVTAAILCALPYALAIGGLSKKKSLGDFFGRVCPGGWSLAITGVWPLGDAPFKFIGQFSEAIHPVAAMFLGIWLLANLVPRLRERLVPSDLRRPSPAVGFVTILGAVLITPALIGLYLHVHYLSHRHLLLLGALASPLIGAGTLLVAEWITRLPRRIRPSARRDRETPALRPF